MATVSANPLARKTSFFGANGYGYIISKRGLDIVVSSVTLLLLLPLCTLIALLIRAEGEGPILYWQERVGRGGKRFRFYKFRSMVVNADKLRIALEARNEANGPIFKIKDDPRVTRVGRVLRRYSLDELPQLMHVLKGEMSLIGPRPHLPREVALYTEEQAERLSVAPGLLCLREVQGRSHLSFEEWVELDLHYVRNRSLFLDLSIMLRVIPAVLKAEGAY